MGRNLTLVAGFLVVIVIGIGQLLSKKSAKNSSIQKQHPDSEIVDDFDLLDSLDPVYVENSSLEEEELLTDISEEEEEPDNESDSKPETDTGITNIDSEKCTQERYSLGECDKPLNGTNSSNTQSTKIRPKPKKDKEVQEYNGWAALTASEPTTITGARSNYVGPVLKSRCRMMAVIEDSIVVSDSNRKEVITLSVKGSLSGCSAKSIEGLRLGGTAKIAPNGKWITAEVDTCVLAQSNYPSVSCKGVVESISGSDVLEGKIYDKSMFGSVVESAINVSGLVMLKDLAGAASSVENMWSASTTSSVANAFKETLSNAANKVAQAFQGREIHLAQGAPVIVTILKDVEL